MDTKISSRKPNIELMRVIAMIMVTMLHALGHGGVLALYDFGSVGYIIMWLIETLSYVSVNLFVLITGYFMVNSDFKISRIIKLSVQVEFYSLICLIIAKFVLKQGINIEDIVRAVFPLTGGIYWFASSYVVLIALSPMLNRFIHSISKNELFLTCILLCVIFCVIPTFLFWGRNVLSNGSEFIWFTILYFTAAYIRFYGDDTAFLKRSNGKYLAVYIIFCLIGLMSRLVIGQLGKIIYGQPKFEGIFYSYNSVIIFTASICLFMFFKNIKIENKILSKVITGIGSVCFGAYLYSDNPFLRKPLWDIVNISEIVRNAGLGSIILLIAVVLVIFLIGCIIEWVRSCVFNLIGISKIINKSDRFIRKVNDKLISFSNEII